jgi:cytochrome c2
VNLPEKLRLASNLTVVASVLTMALFSLAFSLHDQKPRENPIDYAPDWPPFPPPEDTPETLGEIVFNSNCKSCHRIHLKLVGPALNDVFKRRDSLWIRNMILNSQKMVKAGDRRAVALFNEYNQAQMTAFEGMKEVDLRHLFEYLKMDHGSGYVP